MGAVSPDTGGERAQQHQYVAVGRVVRPHGVHGNLLVEPISDLIKSVQAESKVFLGPDFEELEVVFLKPHRNRYLLSVVDCHSREEAEMRRDQEVSLEAGQEIELPAGTYYQWQILGLEVETEEGERLGGIERIIVTGANDVYVVGDGQGGEVLLPAINQVIRRIDLDQGKMVVHLLPGLRPD